MALELAKTKQILDLLVDKGLLTQARKEWVLDGIQKGVHKGFAGEIVIKQDWGITKEQVDNTLREQAAQKAYGAVADIATIAKQGRQDIPVWLKVNLGNNGVNTSSKQPSPIDGASAAANIAQNIVVLANSAPKELAAELENAVRSSSALALYLSGTYPEPVPLSALQQWQQEANDGLKLAVAHFEKTDALKNAILHNVPEGGQKVPSSQQVDEYLAQRNIEMAAAILQTTQWQNKFVNPLLGPQTGKGR